VTASVSPAAISARYSKFALGGLAAAMLALAAPPAAPAPVAPAGLAEAESETLTVSHRRWRRSRRGPSVQFYFGSPPISPYYGYRYPVYPAPYTRYRYYSAPGPSASCTYWHNRCAANWGYANSNYLGCMRYHRCY
jgi:hypothetical protein